MILAIVYLLWDKCKVPKDRVHGVVVLLWLFSIINAIFMDMLLVNILAKL